MKITFFELAKEDEAIFSGVFGDAEVSFLEGKLDENSVSLAKDADAVCIFVGSTVNKAVIDAMPNLKFIATRSTGFNHIDCAYAKSKGIQVSNVPAYGSHTVAEFAFGLILDLSRKIMTANNFIRQSLDFEFFPTMEGFNLEGKTLGVIGTGKIGRNVIKIARGFAMEVIAYDHHPDAAFAGEFGFTYKTFDEVISDADIITLHAPFTKENYHLINKENISKMKRGVYLINTARGELIDTDALVSGLEQGIIAGAGLDVLEGEKELKEEVEMLMSADRSAKFKDYKTLLEDHILMEMPNVIITPHIAFYAREAVAEIFKTTIENIKGLLSNAPINLVE